jgi:hypothetical protein
MKKKTTFVNPSKQVNCPVVTSKVPPPFAKTNKSGLLGSGVDPVGGIAAN